MIGRIVIAVVLMAAAAALIGFAWVEMRWIRGLLGRDHWAWDLRLWELRFVVFTVLAFLLLSLAEAVAALLGRLFPPDRTTPPDT